MKIHPLMLAAAITFWGWQSGQWLIAVLAAGSLCASFYTSVRWALSRKQLYRVADFCAVVALLLGGYFYLTFGNPRVIILTFQWLPVSFLPLALAHAYGTAERMDLAVLFWSWRRRPPDKSETFDPWFPYFAVWIIAAASANMRSEWFYVGLVALVAWPLLRIRPRSPHPAIWGGAFLLAVGLGYGVQYQLHSTQAWLEEAVPEWISSDGSLSDPYRANTNMGSIGKLKESDAIVLRVVTPDGTAPPTLLHIATYNTYYDKSWLARSAGFSNIKSEGNNRWPLTPDRASSRATIYDYTAGLNPVLSLPGGTSAIEGLKAVSVQRNRLGSVQIVRKPSFFSYVVAYSPNETYEGTPAAEDLKLPGKEQQAFETLAAKLGLKAQTPAAQVERVRNYFADGYEYSTYLEQAPTGASPIVNFLLHSKSGHCEYFATATVLLLRAGGVPTRYATGFALREKSDLENAYIARQRHRHAWARAYVNGAWVDVDTTPPSWLAIEGEGSGVWTSITDWWSWLRFRVAQAWASGDERLLYGGALAAGFPLVIWLVWRLYRSRRVFKVVRQQPVLVAHRPAGADSDYYRVEKHLSERGYGRNKLDTTREWLARLDASAPIDTVALAEIVELHNRYRFDPAGLTDTQRAMLKDAADRWLAKQRGVG